MDLLKPHFGLLIWTFLAFLVVLFILGKYAWPAITKGLKQREQGIADSLASAERVRAEMAQLKNENEELLAKAREERGQILREARETKEKIIGEAKEQAKVEANKIITETQAAINAQKMAAVIDVKNQVGKMVIEISEKVLRKEMENNASHEAYIKGMIEDVKLN